MLLCNVFIFPFCLVDVENSNQIFRSQPSQQGENNHDHQQQSHDAAGCVSPTGTVTPGGQNSDQREYQQNDQYGSKAHVFPLIQAAGFV